MAGRKPEADRIYPRRQINKLSGEARRLIGDLKQFWPWHTVTDAFGGGPKTNTAEQEEREPSTSMPSWVQKAEDFVAIQAIIYLSQFFILLRTMTYSMVWVSVLLLLAATAYPFQPEQMILYLLLGLVAAVVGAILWMFVRVNKNEIVSRITRSTPNKFEFNWAFVLSVLQYIGPIAIVTIAHLSGRLRTIVEPLLEVVR